MDYGGNIYSSKKRSDKRRKTHQEVTSYERNKRLGTLNTTFPPNEEVLSVFEADRGKYYVEVTD